MKKQSLYEPLLLEIAWEVCNKVGGIYTVIQSKVPYVKKRWGDQYCTLGPLLSDKLPVEFQPTTDYSDAFGKAVLKMRELGFEVEYGYWLIDGKPKTILLPIQQAMGSVSQYKQQYSQNHHVILYEEPLINKVMAFGSLIVQFLQILDDDAITTRKILAHFHEWMSAPPIAELKRLNINIATVFTTHATMLGRYMAMNTPNFYQTLPYTDWRQEARRFHIETQVGIERLAAHHCEVLSTVSQITDQECEYLLGRKSDVIVPNGLNIDRFIAMRDIEQRHQRYKDQIHEFTMGHFFNNYTFDLDNTLYFFTSGRYEYVNKGYDLTLEALKRLNKRMKKAKINKTVVMFFITRRPYRTINPLVLQLRSLVEEVKQTCDKITTQIEEKLFKSALQRDSFDLPDLNELVDEYWQFRYKKTLQKLKTEHLPIVVTHNLKNDHDDEILKFVRENEFYNRADDRVKVVYHPDFIDSTNPLFKLDYFQFVRGCHLGVFPSYYEPWGYTPIECLVRGIPSITSDLSGFGDYAQSHLRGLAESGLFIVNRRYSKFEQSVEQLTDHMFYFVQQKARDRILQRAKAEKISENFAWESLGRFYMEAYRKAMDSF